MASNKKRDDLETGDDLSTEKDILLAQSDSEDELFEDAHEELDPSSCCQATQATPGDKECDPLIEHSHKTDNVAHNSSETSLDRNVNTGENDQREISSEEKSLNEKLLESLHLSDNDGADIENKTKSETEIGKDGIPENVDKHKSEGESSGSSSEDEEDDAEEGDVEKLQDEKKNESSEEEESEKEDEEGIKEYEAQLSEEELEERRNAGQKSKVEGNELFRQQNFTAAIVAYTEALRHCPRKYPKDRSIMFSNRAACKLHLEKHKEAIDDCSRALDLNPHYMKALLRRAELYEKTEKLDDALADYQKALEMDPSLYNAREACMRLPEQINERNEKMKAEMMSKLKDLGNMILRPFGLSTNNFQMQQDPNTGSYSVNFQQNPPPQQAASSHEPTPPPPPPPPPPSSSSDAS